MFLCCQSHSDKRIIKLGLSEKNNQIIILIKKRKFLQYIDYLHLLYYIIYNQVSFYFSIERKIQDILCNTIMYNSWCA